jgi:hypothetical protein
MAEVWSPRRQGDAGELSALQWLISVGAAVYLPFGHSPDVDLVADLEGRLVRVQVKTSIFSPREGRFDVALRTSGGNQSWSRIIKRLDPSRCDYLFVHVGDGRRWFIPADQLGGSTAIVVGGPKYAEFEVDPGAPLPARIAPGD